MEANNKALQKPPLFWAHVACAAFLILWLDVGAAGTAITSMPGLIKIGVLGAWLTLAVARSHDYGHALIRSIWPLLLMLLIAELYAEQVPRSPQYIQGLGYLAIAFALGSFYVRPKFRLERTALVFIMLADFAITGARTFVALQTDPQVSRYLAAPEEVRATVYGSKSFAGLGGYSFAYSLAPVVVLLLFFSVRLRKRFWLIGGLAMATILLVELSFTTAIVLALGVGFVFLIQDVVRNVGVRLLCYAVVMIGWGSGLYSDALRSAAHAPFLSQDVAQRLEELAQFLSGQSSAGSDLSARQGLWSDSLATLLANGPFGIAGGGLSQKTGGHSEWLDLMASYGVFISILALFFVYAWRQTRGHLANYEAQAVKRAWIFFVLLGAVNTVLFSTIVLTWMFLVPGLTQWLAERPQKHSKPLEAGPGDPATPSGPARPSSDPTLPRTSSLPSPRLSNAETSATLRGPGRLRH